MNIDPIKNALSGILNGVKRLWGRKDITNNYSKKDTLLAKDIMNNYSKKDILAILKGVEKKESDLGIIIDKKIYNDNKLLIILHDFSFLSASNFKNTFNFIKFLINYRMINLVACDGAIRCEEIDTGWISGIQDLDMQTKIADNLYESGKLTPVEYCHIWAKNNNTPFILFGPEDEKLYLKANELFIKYAPLRKYILENGNTESALLDASKIPEFQPLFGYFLEFDKVDHERAKIILQNLLKKMDEKKTEVVIMVGKGNIPKYISEIANEKKISHIIIDPTKSKDDNYVEFEKRIKEQYERNKSK